MEPYFTRNELELVKSGYNMMDMVSKTLMRIAGCPQSIGIAITPTEKIRISSFFKATADGIRKGKDDALAFYSNMGPLTDARKLLSALPIVIDEHTGQDGLNMAADFVNELAVLFGTMYPVVEFKDDHYQK